jgi:two-component system invasion response regulator UvrY
MNTASVKKASRKLLIIDDHALARIAVKALLQSLPQLTIVAEAASGSEAIALAKQHLPDVILLDVELPDLSGVEVAKRLLQIQPFRIIVLTSHTDHFYIGQLLRLGVSGYLSKNCRSEDLIQALCATDKQPPLIDPQMAENLSQHLFTAAPATTPFDDLSQRQLEILLMLCRGEKIATIAKHLFLSPKTVNTHRRSLYKKLQVNTTGELAKLALHHKLVDND